MELIGQILGSIGGLGFLICYILFIVQMFLFRLSRIWKIAPFGLV